MWDTAVRNRQIVPVFGGRGADPSSVRKVNMNTL